MKSRKSRKRKVGSGKRILISYEIVTPESAEIGDFAETGWINEDGVSMAPDADDRAEGITAVDKAIDFLKREYVQEASSSHFHKGVWYSNEPDQDFRTGAEETHNFHLKGFSEDEERAIYNALVRAR